MSSARASCAVLAAVFLASTQAQGTRLVPTPPETLAGLSDAVVHARVVALKSRWAGTHEIITVAELEVKEAWKGNPPPRLRVVTEGGEVNGVGQHVAGAPEFSVGEEVVLFLYRVGGDVYSVTGMAQGKYRVEHDAGAPSWLVPQPNDLHAPAVPLRWDALRKTLRGAP